MNKLTNYMHSVKTEADYNAYVKSADYKRPNVCFVTDTSVVHYSEAINPDVSTISFDAKEIKIINDSDADPSIKANSVLIDGSL